MNFPELKRSDALLFFEYSAKVRNVVVPARKRDFVHFLIGVYKQVLGKRNSLSYQVLKRRNAVTRAEQMR